MGENIMSLAEALIWVSFGHKIFKKKSSFYMNVLEP